MEREFALARSLKRKRTTDGAAAAADSVQRQRAELAASLSADIVRQLRTWASTSARARAAHIVGSTQPCTPELCTPTLVSVRARADVHDFCATRYCRARHAAAAADAACAERERAWKAADAQCVCCERHMRVHVCLGTESTCRAFVYRNSLGFRVCMMSGRIVQASLDYAFGDGSTYTPAGADAQAASAAASTARASAATAAALVADDDDRAAAAVGNGARRRPRGGSGGGGGAQSGTVDRRVPLAGTVDELLFMSRTTDRRRSEHDAHTATTQRLGASAAYDEDFFRSGLFDDAYTANSFGDGMGEHLDWLYGQAYSSVDRLLFSADRARIEQRTRTAALALAHGKVRAYVRTERQRGNGVVELVACQQLFNRFLRRGHLPNAQLVVPPGAIRRLRAYYALLCVEFYLNLMDVATAVIEQRQRAIAAALPRRGRRARGAAAAADTPARRAPADRITVLADQFVKVPFSALVPNLLDLLRVNVQRVLAEPDSVLEHVFPTPTTLEELGYGQNTCTNVKKTVKQLMALMTGEFCVRQCTTLDAVFVLALDARDCRTSVVQTFVRARLARARRRNDGRTL